MTATTAWTTAVLAHGGRFTWDEALLVLVPIAVFAGLLGVAHRRANALLAAREAASEAPPADRGSANDLEHPVRGSS